MRGLGIKEVPKRALVFLTTSLLHLVRHTSELSAWLYPCVCSLCGIASFLPAFPGGRRSLLCEGRIPLSCVCSASGTGRLGYFQFLAVERDAAVTLSKLISLM